MEVGCTPEYKVLMARHSPDRQFWADPSSKGTVRIANGTKAYGGGLCSLTSKFAQGNYLKDGINILED